MRHGLNAQLQHPLFLILLLLLLPVVTPSTTIETSNKSSTIVDNPPIGLDIPRKSNPATFFGVDGLRSSSSSSSSNGAKSRDVLEAELEDELRREFVRVSSSHSQAPSSQYFNKKTYSLPRQFECYSCMSLIYQDNWQFLQLMYTAPKVFTNRLQRAIDPKKHSNGAVWICMCHFAGAQCRSWCVPRLQVHKGL
uniref:Secreted protein n=1 Tax=Ditylenchus dipsaci TaxID=166011 RepID=A0A915DRR8_9BILA